MASNRAPRGQHFESSIGFLLHPARQMGNPHCLPDASDARAARFRLSSWVSALALLLSAVLAPAALGQPANPDLPGLSEVQEKLAGLRDLQASAAARIACLRLVADSLQAESLAGQERLGPLKQQQEALASETVRLQELNRLHTEQVEADEKQVAASAAHFHAALATFRSRDNGWFRFWRPGTWRWSLQELQTADRAYRVSRERLRESNEKRSAALAELENLQFATAESRATVDTTSSEIENTKTALRDLRSLFQKLRITFDTLTRSIAAAGEVNATEVSAAEQLTRHAAEVDDAARQLSLGLDKAAGALPADRVNKHCPATP